MITQSRGLADKRLVSDLWIVGVHYNTKVLVAYQKQVRGNFLTRVTLTRFEELIRHSYAPIIQSLKSI